MAKAMPGGPPDQTGFFLARLAASDDALTRLYLTLIEKREERRRNEAFQREMLGLRQGHDRSMQDARFDYADRNNPNPPEQANPFAGGGAQGDPRPPEATPTPATTTTPPAAPAARARPGDPPASFLPGTNQAPPSDRFSSNNSAGENALAQAMQREILQSYAQADDTEGEGGDRIPAAAAYAQGPATGVDPRTGQPSGTIAGQAARNRQPPGTVARPPRRPSRQEVGFREIHPEWVQRMRAAEEKYGLPGGVLLTLYGYENGGGRHLGKNPRSSANGLFQFTDAVRKQWGVRNEDALNPNVMIDAAARNLRHNANAVKQLTGKDMPTDPQFIPHWVALHQWGVVDGSRMVAAALSGAHHMPASEVMLRTPRRNNATVLVNNGLSSGATVGNIFDQTARRAQPWYDRSLPILYPNGEVPERQPNATPAPATPPQSQLQPQQRTTEAPTTLSPESAPAPQQTASVEDPQASAIPRPPQTVPPSRQAQRTESVGPFTAIRRGPSPHGVKPHVQAVIDEFRQRYPTARITSGYRSPRRNAEVGGAGGSQHTKATAFDFSLQGLSPEKQAEAVNFLRSRGAVGIGNYGGTSFHADWRTGWPNVAWGPNYSHSSLHRTPRWFQQIASEHRGGRRPPATPQTQVAQQQPRPQPNATSATAAPAAPAAVRPPAAVKDRPAITLPEGVTLPRGVRAVPRYSQDTATGRYTQNGIMFVSSGAAKNWRSQLSPAAVAWERSEAEKAELAQSVQPQGQTVAAPASAAAPEQRPLNPVESQIPFPLPGQRVPPPLPNFFDPNKLPRGQHGVLGTQGGAQFNFTPTPVPTQRITPEQQPQQPLPSTASPFGGNVPLPQPRPAEAGRGRGDRLMEIPAGMLAEDGSPFNEIDAAATQPPPPPLPRPRPEAAGPREDDPSPPPATSDNPNEFDIPLPRSRPFTPDNNPDAAFSYGWPQPTDPRDDFSEPADPNNPPIDTSQGPNWQEQAERFNLPPVVPPPQQVPEEAVPLPPMSEGQPDPDPSAAVGAPAQPAPLAPLATPPSGWQARREAINAQRNIHRPSGQERAADMVRRAQEIGIMPPDTEAEPQTPNEPQVVVPPPRPQSQLYREDRPAGGAIRAPAWLGEALSRVPQSNEDRQRAFDTAITQWLKDEITKIPNDSRVRALTDWWNGTNSSITPRRVPTTRIGGDANNPPQTPAGRPQANPGPADTGLPLRPQPPLITTAPPGKKKAAPAAPPFSANQPVAPPIQTQPGAAQPKAAPAAPKATPRVMPGGTPPAVQVEGQRPGFRLQEGVDANGAPTYTWIPEAVQEEATAE